MLVALNAFCFTNVNGLSIVQPPSFLSHLRTRHFLFDFRGHVRQGEAEDASSLTLNDWPREYSTGRVFRYSTAVPKFSRTRIAQSAMNISSDTPITWGEWFAMWWASETGSPDDFTKSQLSLDDGWRIIESDADKIMEEEVLHQVSYRREEVQKLSELAKRNTSNINWRRIFANVLEVSFDSGTFCTDSTVQEQTSGKTVPLGPLPSPMRLSIVNNLAKEENEVWLEAMRALVHREKTPEELGNRFNEFERSWKGTFSYSASLITARMALL